MDRLTIKNNRKLLGPIIESFLNSKHYKSMIESDAYYEYQNEKITTREKMMWMIDEIEKTIDGEVKVEEVEIFETDFTKANYKVIHGFHNELINQCKNFLAGKPVRISWKDDVDIDHKIRSIIDDILYRDNKWASYNQENIKNAQKYAIAWSRVVLNDKGKLRLINVDSKEVIHFTNDYDELECVIRIYEKEEYDSNAVKQTVKYAEVYDEKYKDIYTSNSSHGNYTLLEGDVPLLYTTIEFGDNVVSKGKISEWSTIPWIMWKNNDDGMNSLKPIKTFIDILDIDLSDLANNIDDVQDAIWILENYEGQSISEFMRDLKRRKAINVGEGGSVDNKVMDIPFEARMKLYEVCEKSIYKFGRGIDFAQRENLGNSTGVALKWSYGPLDEKSDEIEAQGQVALDTMFELILDYLKLTGVSIPEEINSNAVEFIFDRTLITNEKEKVEMVLGSSSILSRKTQLEYHPFVDDADDELDRLNQDYAIGINQELPPEMPIVKEVVQDDIGEETGRNKRALSTY